MRSFAIVIALACTATALPAQSLRPFTTFKQRHGEREIAARVAFSGKSFRLAPGKPNEVYRMTLTYDPSKYTPLSTFDTTTKAWRIGVTENEHPDEPGVKMHILFTSDSSGPHDKQSAAITLSPDIDAALDLELGSAKVNLEFGGLRVTSLNLISLGETRVQFTTPNLAACRQASVAGGIGMLSLVKLGNSRCRKVTFKGGVGALLLDFGGTWTSDMNVDATTAVGPVTLRLPREVGVRVTMKKFLAGWEPNGLIRRGDAFVSSNYDSATRKLHIDLTTMLGATTVEWIGD